MSIGLDLGSTQFRSLRRQGRRLVVRACPCVMTCIADTPAHRLMIERDGPPSRIYVVCDRVDSEIGRLVEEGIELISPPHRIFEHADDRLGPSGTEEWQAFVKDSEGNLVGLIEFRTGS